MSRFFKSLALALLLGASMPAAFALDDFAAVGRPATPAEIKAWDIDVGPDFAGLPQGSGSVEQGQAVFEEKCAVCHGSFGESNKVFSPLVGGVEKGDLVTGHVAALLRKDFPARTTFMKVATVSTLFDYIRRAMPWNAPKSLNNDQVYAVLAYLLNLSDIVTDDFVLNDRTIRDVQKIMPNRNGMTYEHSMWPSPVFSGKPVKPDTANTACMSKCKAAPELVSSLPDYALSSHGNLAEQNRSFGEVRGRKTAESAPVAEKPTPLKIAETAGCLGCHAINAKGVGPAYAEVAAKYKGENASARLVAKIRGGGAGVWGDVAMPAQEDIKDADLQAVVAWVLAGAAEK
ncbi:c-type cytochrome [uncultured Rhodoblastus sp.]|uniref:c-type cytochrome n=1 Tax=uncultured Rhodoblastus sp. TaxID=543037 RepID=UPI0025DD2EBC|nr:c-type cytochrome [uncultured Rhodoblastus sp.]